MTDSLYRRLRAAGYVLPPTLRPMTEPAPGANDVVPFPATRPEKRHFLMLQGPFGPFFRYLGRTLRAAGHEVTKVHINGCDVWDWRGSGPALWFRGPRGSWSIWLDSIIVTRNVTDVILYGDCQSYHREAVTMARALGLRIHVLEQGYFRPHWVTLERDGVNGFSPMLSDPRPVPHLSAEAVKRLPQAQHTGNMRRAHVLQTILSNLAFVLFAPLFPGYRSPYAAKAASQAWGHMRRYLWLRLTRARRLEAAARFVDEPAPFYLVLLQRPGDSQLTVHSSFPRLADVSHTVIESFAKHAPADARLLFKCHPLDPGLEDHEAAIRACAARLGIEDRVAYLDGGILRDLVERARGSVTVNSTAGLTALEAGCPTIALGTAIYDRPGLTWQGGLDRFWTGADRPHPDLLRGFKARLLMETQVNGNFWTRTGCELAVPVIAGRAASPNAEEDRPAEVVPSVEPELPASPRSLAG